MNSMLLIFDDIYSEKKINHCNTSKQNSSVKSKFFSARCDLNNEVQKIKVEIR